jgi:hypothetical protein
MVLPHAQYAPEYSIKIGGDAIPQAMRAPLSGMINFWGSGSKAIASRSHWRTKDCSQSSTASSR